MQQATETSRAQKIQLVPVRPPRKVRPPTKGVQPSIIEDTSKRQLAACEAASLSWSWAPEAGIAKGLTLGTPIAKRKFEGAVRRVAQFEAVATRSSVVTWHKWVEHGKLQGLKSAPRSWDQETLVYLDDSIDASSSARTTSLAVYNKMLWMQRHVSAPVDLCNILKPEPPNRQRADYGP